MLGRQRASSVFTAPARAAFSAKSFSEAVVINRELGCGICKQSWAMAPKMRVVDNPLQTWKQLRNMVRECHPEVCFNGGTPMAHNIGRR